MKAQKRGGGSRKLPSSKFSAYAYLTNALTTPISHNCTRKYNLIQGWCQWGQQRCLGSLGIQQYWETISFSPLNGARRLDSRTSLKLPPPSASQAVDPLGVVLTPIYIGSINDGVNSMAGIKNGVHTHQKPILQDFQIELTLPIDLRLKNLLTTSTPKCPFG